MSDLGHLNDEERDELRKIFYSQAYEMLEDLQDLFLVLEENPEDTETLKAVQRILHTLKGDSNSIGLRPFGNLCHALEDVTTLIRQGTVRVNQEATALLFQTAETLERMLLLSERGEDVAALEKSGADAIAAYTRGRPDLQVRKEERYANLTEYERLQAADARSRGHRVLHAEVVLHTLCPDPEIAAFMLTRSLEDAAEVIAKNTGVQADGASVFTCILSTGAAEEELRGRLLIAGVSESVTLIAIPDVQFPGNGGLPAEAGPDRAELPSRSKSAILRIEASKVDAAMNQVGELIISRSIIDRIARDLESTHADHSLVSRLLSASSSMERTIADLQKSVMKMRMVPVHQVFRKFPKVVRELAAEKGKNIRLEILGRETEMDKAVVDALGEPLLHIVRNCVDHGVEGPEERAASGKPLHAIIRLRAYHEGSRTVIEIGDDGRGIDAARLRERAISQGLLSPEESGRMTDEDALSLMFISGLSTSVTVGTVSGRGIGMDAVKHAIEEMKGTITVESTTGMGTKFTLRLPLTLAIIRALLFESGRRLFAIPVSALTEVARTSGRDLISVDGTSTLILRDKIISVISLDRLITRENEPKGKNFILVLGIGGKEMGLMVDRLLGQQELVLKAVETEYSRSGLVSGASILGDGKIVMILDPAAVMQSAVARQRQKVQTP